MLDSFGTFEELCGSFHQQKAGAGMEYISAPSEHGRCMRFRYVGRYVRFSIKTSVHGATLAPELRLYERPQIPYVHVGHSWRPYIAQQHVRYSLLAR
jgi:hypothetical protein